MLFIIIIVVTGLAPVIPAAIGGTGDRKGLPYDLTKNGSVYPLDCRGVYCTPAGDQWSPLQLKVKVSFLSDIVLFENSSQTTTQSANDGFSAY